MDIKVNFIIKEDKFMKRSNYATPLVDVIFLSNESVLMNSPFTTNDPLEEDLHW